MPYSLQDAILTAGMETCVYVEALKSDRSSCCRSQIEFDHSGVEGPDILLCPSAQSGIHATKIACTRVTRPTVV